MHIISRKLLTTIARLVLAVMLFAQYSLATQACMLPEAAPAMAFATDDMPEDCHMQNTDKHNPNACFVHCTSDYQTLGSHHGAFDLPVVMLPTVLTTVIASAPTPSRYHPVVLARIIGPPPYLLHQNFRI